MTWWESFSTDINENGTLKYATVWKFVKSRTQDKAQRRLLWWVLGPINPEDSSDEFEKYDRFDWANRRQKGFWYESPNSGDLAKTLASKQNALEKMQEVGKINVGFINRLEALCIEIDKEYSGRLFLPSLSAKENQLRANTYMRLLSQVQGMMEQAQLMYGRTQGLDLQRLDQFFAMFGKGMGEGAAQALGLGNNGQSVQTPASKAMMMVLDMTMRKAADRELDLPDPEMVDIIKETHKPQLIKKERIN